MFKCIDGWEGWPMYDNFPRMANKVKKGDIVEVVERSKENVYVKRCLKPLPFYILPYSLNIPLDEFEKCFKEIPKEQTK